MSGFQSPNHTQTPNEFFDVHMMSMGEAELKVTLAIIRKTLGYHKKSDPISLTQLQKAIGLSRQGAQDGATAAVKRGLVEIVGKGKRGVTIYGLVIRDDQSTALTSQETINQSTVLTSSSLPSRPVEAPTSLLSRHTKEIKTLNKPLQIKKDNTPALKRAAGVDPEKPKLPKSLRNWNTRHVINYHTEYKADLDALTHAFYTGENSKNDELTGTIPYLSTKEGKLAIETYQELCRIGYGIEHYKPLIAHTRQMRPYKKEITWWDVQDSIGSYGVKIKATQIQESKTKDSLELENQKAYELIIARSKGAKFDAMGELIVEGVG